MIFLLCFGIAEESYSQLFYLGVNAGAGPQMVRYMRKEYRDQFKSKILPGGHAGIALNVPLTNDFNFASEFNYSLRGRKVEPIENSWTLSEIHHFLEVPLILNIKREGEIKQIGPFESIGPFTWFFGAGPNISYLLGGSGKLITYAMTSNYDISFGGKEGDYHYVTFRDANRWQWGIDIQIGLISPLIRGDQLISKLRFTYGHTHLGPFDGSSMPVLGFADNIAHNYKILNLSFTYLLDMDINLLRKGRSISGQGTRSAPTGGQAPRGENINKLK